MLGLGPQCNAGGCVYEKSSVAIKGLLGPRWPWLGRVTQWELESCWGTREGGTGGGMVYRRASVSPLTVPGDPVCFLRTMGSRWDH